MTASDNFENLFCEMSKVRTPSLKQVFDAKAEDLKKLCSEARIVTKPSWVKFDYASALMERYSLLAVATAPAESASTASAVPAATDPADNLTDLIESFKREFDDKLQKAVDQVTSACDSKIAAVELSAKQQYEALQAEVVGLKADKLQLQTSLNFTGNQVHHLQGQVGHLQAEGVCAADSAEVEKRRGNIVLSNLPDAETQDTAEQAVADLLDALELGIKPKSIRYIQRSYAAVASSAPSQSAGPGSRPGARVLVSFEDVQASGAAFRAARKLRGTKFSRTSLDIDLTPAQQRERSRQHFTFKGLIEAGRRPRWRGTRIFVDGRPYQAVPSPVHATPTPAVTPMPCVMHTNSFAALSSHTPK